MWYGALRGARVTRVLPDMTRKRKRAMDAGNIIRALRPNVTALGYALFLAINAAGVWGGVFPFLPLDFQTPEIVFWFFCPERIVPAGWRICSSVRCRFLEKA